MDLPHVREFLEMAANEYSRSQLLRMEKLMLRILTFNISGPTPLNFLQFYCTDNNLSDRVKYLAMVSLEKIQSFIILYVFTIFSTCANWHCWKLIRSCSTGQVFWLLPQLLLRSILTWTKFGPWKSNSLLDIIFQI